MTTALSVETLQRITEELLRTVKSSRTAQFAIALLLMTKGKQIAQHFALTAVGLSSLPLSLAESLWETVKPTPAKRFLSKGQIRRVAVIGAGCSGITAAKEALAAGFEVVVFEQTDKIGGNWVFRENEAHSSIYRSCMINTSKQLMAFSDYPIPDHYPTYPHHTQIVKYFNDYANHFNVTPHVRFHSQVLNLELNQDGHSWTITYRQSPDETPLYMKKSFDDCITSVEQFDAVLVCNGHHSVPKWPSFPGMESFQGHMIHSHQYKDPLSDYDFRDKKVLVVGIGNSGVDIANELSRSAKQVYLSTRSGAWVFPKYYNGKPMDQILTPHRLTFSMIPKFMRDWVWLLKLGAKDVEDKVNQFQGSMESWGLKPAGSIISAHPTISHEILHRVGTGTVRIKPNIQSMAQSSVQFVDGSVAEVDAVIFCTGYNISFPFLKDTLLGVQDNAVQLFKYVFSPDLPPTISIIGLIQPLGAIMPISEMQSRWVMQVLKGHIGIEIPHEMRRDMEKKQMAMKKRYLTRARHTIQVDFASYMNEIAEIIGAYPSLWNPSNWRALRPLLAGPCWPHIYRLQGPNPWVDAVATLNKCVHDLDERPEKEASQL
eukprot:TRINITY_DN10326_c0_g3_i2.p1 TRINITY_DN10326_c0_g3~~TRINITY_DN10326_c0_g3_i2.p1  ORF type:complete len:610 (-),score=127.14 TRINITY_DN10326_c0_g3_i2:127-1926(-)